MFEDCKFEKIKIDFDTKKWKCVYNIMELINEEECLSLGFYPYLSIGEDMAYYCNDEKKISIDVGIYGEKYKLPWVGYTIKVIDETIEDDAYGWDNPLETIKVMSSYQLKETIEKLLKKYE